MNNLQKYIRQIMAIGIVCIFLFALSSVNWSLTDLFLTPDQQGKLFMSKNNFKAAADHFLDPMQQGTALYRNGDFKKAAAAFGRGESAAAIYNYSTSLLMAGQYDTAITGYEKALSIKPGWPEAKENLALARARKEMLAPPDDDAGGTGGKLAADEIVFNDRAANAPDSRKEVVEGTEQISDQEMRAMWLRRVQTKPADFLRAKFSYQYMTNDTKGEMN